jgi:hypothetical protein
MLKKYHVTTYGIATWEVEAPDEEAAIAMAENGEAKSLDGLGFCAESECVEVEMSNDETASTAPRNIFWADVPV